VPPMQQPSYGQPAAAAAAPRIDRKKLLIIIVIAAAVAAFLLIINLAGGFGGKDNAGEEEFLTIEINIAPPEGKDPPPFELTEGGFTTYDPGIKMIEVNQGLSNGFDTVTGEIYPIENFAAGRETAIFVNLAEPPDPKAEISLTIERDGEKVVTLLPLSIVDETSILFQPIDLGEVGYWGQGAYTFTFDMDGASAFRTTNFFETTKLKILAMPMVVNYSGSVERCTDKWQNTSQMILDVFPIGADALEYVLGPELDLSNDRFDINTSMGRFNVWRAIREQQTPNNDYTLIVGFMPKSCIPEPGKAWAGYTCGMPANIISEESIDCIATVVHEISHCYFIGDEYPGGCLNPALNQPPYGMEGIDIVSREPSVGTSDKVVGAAEYGIDGSGSVVYPEQRAYRLRDRTLLGPVSSYMGYATGEDPYTRWITSDIWNHLFNSYTGQSAWQDKGDDIEFEYWGQCPSCLGDIIAPNFAATCHNCGDFAWVRGDVVCQKCETTTQLNEYNNDEFYVECTVCWDLIWFPAAIEFNSTKETNDETGALDRKDRVIKITGYADADGAYYPDPWFVYEGRHMPAITTKSDGEYAVNFYDSAGKRLSVVYFDADLGVQASAEGEQFYVESESVPVEATALLPENTAKITIQKGGQEIFARDVSKNAPTVAFTGLSEGQEIPDKTTLTWEASGAGTGDLYFEIWYLPKEDEQFLLETGITGNSCEIDLSNLAGTDDGYFLILASDGVNTSESKSAGIKVQYKAPIIIADNSETIRLKVTDDYVLNLDIYDRQDGWLKYEKTFVEHEGWIRNDVGEWLLDGEHFDYSTYLFVLPYTIQPGEHTLTRTAKNSVGLVTSKDFKIEIIDDESDLPDDWSRNDIRHALSLGFTAPLDWLDSPITIEKYAVFMTVLYRDLSTLDTLYPNFFPIIGEEYKGDDPFVALMVYIGAMDAPDGYIDEYRTMTQREAAIIMYKTMALALSPDLPDDFFSDEDYILEKLNGMGIFDESGPAEYRADEKCSSRIAMVWLSRFYYAASSED
ncbi:MAG: hypothetical protein FWG03_11090, partial [Clostridiales bacterium]|nr:hypothetical protein [Clostridiales bacterium]